VQFQSINDVRFNGKVKHNANKPGDIGSGTFYQSVHLTTVYYQESKATCLEPTFSLNNAANGIRGRLFCSDAFLKELSDKGYRSDDSVKQNAVDRLDDYRTLVRNPGNFCARRGFDVAAKAIRSFHFRAALDPTDDPKLKDNICRMHEMLSFNGLQLMDFNEIVGLGVNGLVSCTCHCYFIRGWCKHSCIYARQRGIVTAYPANKNPTQTGGRRPGRPANSRPGEALRRRAGGN